MTVPERASWDTTAHLLADAERKQREGERQGRATSQRAVPGHLVSQDMYAHLLSWLSSSEVPSTRTFQPGGNQLLLSSRLRDNRGHKNPEPFLSNSLNLSSEGRTEPAFLEDKLLFVSECPLSEQAYTSTGAGSIA